MVENPNDPTPSPTPEETEMNLMTAAEYCKRMDTGLAFIKDRYPEDAAAIDRVRNLLVGKSCLLDRIVYGDEKPSQTPCPVHEGKWAGCHFAWPGAHWSDGTSIETDPRLAQWVADGCRCYQHKCGCTTGWQPDEHCGCLDV